MYEIWLMLNILWEMALGVWPLLAAVVLAWAVMLVLAWRGARNPAGARRRAPGLALAVGAAAAVAAFVALPTLTGSSLRELAYWVDWLSLAGVALGVGAAAFLLAWPLVKLLRRPGAAA